MAPCLQDVRRPTGINIFQLCKALLDGHAEKLSEKVLLHDGPVHLFDVCLQHDCWSIACEMASRGVEGCELQMQHLDPFDGISFIIPTGPSRCTCTGWNECKSYCCWGFPVHQGTWMPDFDVGIWGACEAASKAVGRTWVGQCLRMASSRRKVAFGSVGWSDGTFVGHSYSDGESKGSYRASREVQSSSPAAMGVGGFYLPLWRDVRPSGCSRGGTCRWCLFTGPLGRYVSARGRGTESLSSFHKNSYSI